MKLNLRIILVDDDLAVRESVTLLMETVGFTVETYDSAEAFLYGFFPGNPCCLVLDINMPGMTGLELQAELSRRKIQMPIIFLTGYGDIPITVKAIKAGAIDFLTKPIKGKPLIDTIKKALEHYATMNLEDDGQVLNNYTQKYDLTPRELGVMSLAVAGLSNKEIARHLGISHRTVEIHRARLKDKTGASSILELAQICKAQKLPPDPNSSSDSGPLS